MSAEPVGLPAWIAEQGREPAPVHREVRRGAGKPRLRRVAT